MATIDQVSVFASLAIFSVILVLLIKPRKEPTYHSTESIQ